MCAYVGVLERASGSKITSAVGEKFPPLLKPFHGTVNTVMCLAVWIT